MIDASHGNCAKDHQRMPAVFEEIVAQRIAGERSIIGAMLESNLISGAQKLPQPPDQPQLRAKHHGCLHRLGNHGAVDS